MKEFFFIVWAVIILIANGIGFGIGATDTNIDPGCTYGSIAKVITPGYFIGCQLFKERFLPKEEK